MSNSQTDQPRFTVGWTKAASTPWVLYDRGLPLSTYKTEALAKLKADKLNAQEVANHGQ